MQYSDDLSQFLNEDILPTFERHQQRLADKDAIIADLQQLLSALQNDLGAKEHQVLNLQGRVELLEKDFRLSQSPRRNRAQRSPATSLLPTLPPLPPDEATNDQLRETIEEQSNMLQDQRRSLLWLRERIRTTRSDSPEPVLIYADDMVRVNADALHDLSVPVLVCNCAVQTEQAPSFSTTVQTDLPEDSPKVLPEPKSPAPASERFARLEQMMEPIIAKLSLLERSLVETFPHETTFGPSFCVWRWQPDPLTRP